MENVISIDIGGSNTRVMLFEDGIKTDSKKWVTIKSPEKNFQAIVDYIVSLDKKISKIGISAPGPADYKNGVFGNLPNLPWEGFCFFDFLKEKLGVHNIKADNDANLMALANHMTQGLKKDDVSLFFTISTGIGAGIIINNKIFHGQNGNAAEVQYSPTAWTNSSENKDKMPGGVEGFASGSGLEFIAKKEGVAQTTKELFQKYSSSQKAKSIIDQGIESLANLIATSISLLNPGYIIFDGSVARYNPWYAEKAMTLAKSRVPSVHIKNIKVIFSELGDDSALIGAYHLVKNS